MMTRNKVSLSVMNFGGPPMQLNASLGKDISVKSNVGKNPPAEKDAI